jgi:hypothetical protein
MGTLLQACGAYALLLKLVFASLAVRIPDMEKRHQGNYGKFSPCSNHKEHTGCSANKLGSPSIQVILVV